MCEICVQLFVLCLRLTHQQTLCTCHYVSVLEEAVDAYLSSLIH